MSQPVTEDWRQNHEAAVRAQQDGLRTVHTETILENLEQSIAFAKAHLSKAESSAVQLRSLLGH
jgi:hypothetical protein